MAFSKKVAKEIREALAQIRAEEGTSLAFAREFRRSAKGSLWRKDDCELLTVFQRKDSRYGWSIGNICGGSTEFSRECYYSEDAAMSALFYRIMGAR